MAENAMVGPTMCRHHGCHGNAMAAHRQGQKEARQHVQRQGGILRRAGRLEPGV